MKTENFTLTLETLTPLHIGNGEALNDLDYFYEDDIYYRVSQNQFLDFLEEYEIDLKVYTDWISENVIDDEKIKAYQKDNPHIYNRNKIESKLKANYKLNEFCRENNIESEFAEFLKQNTSQIIHCKVPRAVYKFLKSDMASDRPKEIRGHIRKATGETYLPGTSIKGSIRTALLYNYLKNKADPAKIKSIIVDKISYLASKKRRPSQRDKQESGQILEQMCFFCGKQIADRDVRYDDVQLDLMKLLSISDASVNENPQEFSLADVNLYVLQENPEKDKEQSQTPIVEIIPAGKQLTTQINFNIDFLWHIKKSIKIDNQGRYYIKNDRDKVWIDINKKVNALFGLDIFTLTEQNLEEKKEEVLKHILHQVKAFYTDRLKHDKDWLDFFGKTDPNFDYIYEMKNGYNAVHNNTESYITQIGFATGFHGITQLLYFLKNKDSDLKETIEELLNALEVTKETELANFPRSRRLSNRRDFDMLLPLGFIEISSSDLLPEVSDLDKNSEDKEGKYPEVEMKDIIDNQTDIYATVVGKKRVRLFVKDIPVEVQLVLNKMQKGTILNDNDMLIVQVVQRKRDGNINQVKLIKKLD